ncbi:MAG: hypothetical protein HYX41_08225 [Bdellovibrio sp.]|nr:hypothetical protein [Bdellovibrio sp.]
MRIPETLSKAFGPSPDFETFLSGFLNDEKLLPEPGALKSKRFLTRSIAPHIERLSALFNRENQDQGDPLGAYWKKGTHPENLRLAYFLYFMPANLFRIASIWAELSRLGFQWKAGDLRGVEFGAGPASGATGIATGEKFCPVGIPKLGNWALIEQDAATLGLGGRWANAYFQHLGKSEWKVKEFPRKIDLSLGFLPPKAPKFNLWLMSFFLNELPTPRKELADLLLDSWKHHLENEGVVILVEPALKQQSRKLLELRRELLEKIQKEKLDDFKILLPCLGHQNCGALASPEDWCHEDVSWWRPPYYKQLDEIVELDRKSLPFSYLVITRSKRSRSEILPIPGNSQTHRLVSPAHSEGQDLEFFTCGQDGKRRARLRPALKSPVTPDEGLQRGDILLEAEIRGDQNSSRVQRLKARV